jgi:hypothetical protein
VRQTSLASRLGSLDGMSKLTSDQECQLVDALVGLGWHLQLDAISVGTVRAKFPEIVSDGAALDIIHGLVRRGRLRQEMEPGGQLAVSKPMPIAKSRWLTK